MPLKKTQRRYFNPRSPCGERLPGMIEYEPMTDISIHAPPVGSDRSAISGLEGLAISIHAPPVGSDQS